MIKIRLKKIHLQNFKGLRDVKLEFDSMVTSILGRNGSGKTTIYDAFMWILFDKDSTRRKDFEIKTLDADNKTKKDLEHSVELSLYVSDGDGVVPIEIILKKTYREKWTRKRGTSTDEFNGNETLYYWNNVPMKKEEYVSRIASIVKEEEVFTLLTDLKYFHTLPWQQKRQILFSMVVGTDIEADDPALRERLKNTKPDDLRRELNATKKKLSTAIEQYPIRIDELQRSITESVNLESIADKYELSKKELESIDAQLISIKSSSDNKNKEYSALSKKLLDSTNSINERKNTIINSVKNKVTAASNALDIAFQNEKKIKNVINEIRSDIKVLESKRDRLKVRLQEARDEYVAQFELKITDTSCPSCGREYDESKIEIMVQEFNERKSKKLEVLASSGFALKEEVAQIEKDIISQQKTVDEKYIQLDKIEQQLVELTKQYNTVKEEIETETSRLLDTDITLNELMKVNESLDAEMQTFSNNNTTTDNKELVELKNKHLQIVRSCEVDIAASKNNELINNRITELETQRMRDLDELSMTEKMEFDLSEFIMKKVRYAEERLKDFFYGVEFKMFDVQVNGGISDTCVIMKDGVPYSDLNTASKAWVSLQLIKVFSKKYDLQVPIFIDNRESVSDIPDMPQQVINLVVSKENQKLKLVNNE